MDFDIFNTIYYEITIFNIVIKLLFVSSFFSIIQNIIDVL